MWPTLSLTRITRPALVARATAFACLFGLALAGSPEFANAKPVTHTVVIEATSFVPQKLTVKRGDLIVWINKDPFPHTATSAGAFDSKSIAAGSSWSFKAVRSGTFPYTCTFHPNMKATLQVE